MQKLIEHALALAAETNKRLSRARVSLLGSTEGGMNAVARVSASGGAFFAKLRLNPLDDGAREAWALKLAKGVGPPVVHTTTMRAVAAALGARGAFRALLTDELRGGGLIVTEALPGSARDVLGEHELGAVASTLSRLHRVKPKDKDKPLVGGATAIAALGFADGCLRDLTELRALEPPVLAAIKRALAHARKTLDDTWWDFAGSVPRVLCHGDVRPANLLFASPKGPVACGLVDFEHAGLGDPMIDLGRFAVYAQLSRHQELCLLDAYAEATGDADALDRYFAARPFLPLSLSLGSAVHVARAARGERATAGGDWLTGRRRVVEAQLSAALERTVRLSVNGASPRGKSATRGIIAIDGLAGTGKTPLASALARHLGVPHVNTGAAYRGAALLALAHGLNPEDEDDVAALLRLVKKSALALRADGALTIAGRAASLALDVMPVEENVARWARLPDVRAALRPTIDRAIRVPSAVVEGRDVATVLCPDARHSFFIDIERATRAALTKARAGANGAALEKAIDARNRIDVTRTAAPAVAAKRAVRVVVRGEAGLESALEQIVRAVSRAPSKRA